MEDLLEEAKKAFAKLTDEQRLELWSGYCKECGKDEKAYYGNNHAHCQCWNDE